MYLISKAVETADKRVILGSNRAPALTVIGSRARQVSITFSIDIKIADQDVTAAEVISDGVEITPVSYDCHRLFPTQEGIDRAIDDVPGAG